MQIDVFADVVCPWCYIGEHRLERALAQRPGVEVDWRWWPFQLQPQIPSGGLPWAEFVEKKFGGTARAQAAFRHVVAAGAEDGLTFDFSRVASAPNTMNAHRVILLAQQSGQQQQAARALFEAYFAGGADLNDLDTLVRLASGVGLDAELVRSYLQSDAGREVVQENQDVAARLGISGVPFFILNRKFALSGAQPTETFVAAIDHALAESVA